MICRISFPLSCVAALLLFAVAGCKTATQTPEPPAATAGPLQTATDFLQALKQQDMEQVYRMLAAWENVPDSALREEQEDLKEIADYIASGQGMLIPIEAHEIGDAGVVAIDERRGNSPNRLRDIDGLFLIRQDGVWKVFPEPTSYDDWPVLNDAELQNYRALDAWLEENEARLLEASRAVDIGPWQANQ